MSAIGKTEGDDFPVEHWDSGLVSFDMPQLEGTDVEIRTLIHQIGLAEAVKFDEAMDELQRLCTLFDPIHTLSGLCWDFLVNTGVYQQVATDLPIGFADEQAPIELIHAFYLMTPLDSIGTQIPDIDELRQFYGLAQSTLRSFGMQFLREHSDEDSERARQGVNHAVRLRTAVIRNCGYLFQIIEYATDLFGPLDTEFEQQWGVTATQLITFFKSLPSEFEERYTNLQTVSDHIRQSSTFEEGVRRFNDVMSPVTLTDDMARQIQDHTADQEEAILRLAFGAFFSRLYSLFVFSVDDLDRICDVQGGDLATVFDTWAHALGCHDHGISTREHVILANPVWAKPFIEVRPKTYFLPAIHIFQHSGIDLMESLMPEDIYDIYHNQRAKYLEDRIEKTCRASFPTAQIAAGNKWRPDGSTICYENDLLIVLDSVGIIIEAKSGKIADSAKRGGERLKRDVQKLIVDPSEQATRFKQHLLNNPGVHEFPSSKCERSVNRVDTTSVLRFVTLSVTLDLFGSTATTIGNLIDSGIIGKDQCPISPCMSLGDFEIVMDVLTSEAQRAHYLLQRGLISDKHTYDGDELDLLGMYVKEGLDGFLADDRPERWHLLLSDLFDPHYTGKGFDDGFVLPDKPTKRLSRRWRKTIEQIEQNKRTQWLDQCFAMLDMPFVDQRRFEDELQSARIHYRRRKAKRVVALKSPNGNVIIGIPYHPKDRMSCIEFAEQKAREMFSSSGSNFAMFLGISVKSTSGAPHVLRDPMSR